MPALTGAEIRNHFATQARPGLCHRCRRFARVTRCAEAVLFRELRPGDPVPDGVMEGGFDLCEGCFVAWWNE